MRQYEVIKIDGDTWSIEDGFVRFFLLRGKEKALLLDSGFDIENVRGLSQAILKGDKGRSGGEKEGREVLLFTDGDAQEAAAGEEFPLELLNTHGDGDHCFGNKEFDRFYLHEGDHEIFRRQFGDAGEILPLADGQVIDLGERPLTILHIPGHTFGSVAVLDGTRRMLFAGDSVQNGAVFMFGGHRSLEEYPASLIRLQDAEEQFDVIFASHAKLALDPGYAGVCFDACESMLHGEVESEEQEVHGGRVAAYDCGTVTFLIDPERKFEKAED